MLFLPYLSEAGKRSRFSNRGLWQLYRLSTFPMRNATWLGGVYEGLSYPDL